MEVTLADIRKIVAMQLGKATVLDSDRLEEDLGAGSFDVLNLVTALEERYGIAFQDEDVPAVHTVDDLYQVVKAKLAA